MNRIFITVGLVSCLAVFGLAAGANALTLSPATRVITVDGGRTQTVTITVENEEPQPVIVEPLVTGLKQDTAGRPVFGSGYDTAEKWITPEIKTVTVAPGERKNISFGLIVPVGAEPGSHWVALGVESRPKAGENTVLGKRLLSLLSLQVAGVVTESVSLETKLTRHVLVGQKNIGLQFELANNGTIEVPLSSIVTIRNLAEQPLDTVNFSLGNQLLPGAVRMLEEKIKINATACDEGNFCPQLTWPGLYRVGIESTYGKTEQTVYSEESFWFFPLWSVAALGTIIVVSVVIITRWYRRRQTQKYVA